MTVWYEVYGQIVVHDTPEMWRLVGAYNSIYAENLTIEAAESDTDGIVPLFFGGGAEMSHDGISKIDEAAEAFAAHVTDPAFLTTVYDGDHGFLYIGPPEKTAEAKSKHVFNEILNLIEYLTPADAVALQVVLESHVVAPDSDCRKLTAPN